MEEPASAPKKQKISPSNVSDSKREKKKDKTKGKLQKNDTKNDTNKNNLKDTTKVSESHNFKVKHFRSRKEEKLEKQREARRRRRAKSKVRIHGYNVGQNCCYIALFTNKF